jgi:hypothetical protein
MSWNDGEKELEAFKAEGGRICKCGAWVFDGDGCDTCGETRATEIDALAQSGYPPSIEYFRGAFKGWRVRIFPDDKPSIELGYVKTFDEAVALLLAWKPS